MFTILVNSKVLLSGTHLDASPRVSPRADANAGTVQPSRVRLETLESSKPQGSDCRQRGYSIAGPGVCGVGYTC